ncbi:MAG: histidine kinase, partial [Bacteroidota bacterium]
MDRKFFSYASISAPLLALFGASPFYIFGILTLQQSAKMHISVLISVVLYWLINGFIFLHLKKPRTWPFLVLSYFLTFFSNILKAPFQSTFDFQSTLLEYVVHPIITAIALNTIILLIINSIIGEREKQESARTIASLKLQKLEAENQVLMQQLQPHFLFNALSTMKSLIQEDAELAEEFSLKLSDFLRYSVESHNSDLVSVAAEMQFVRNYIDLQQIRFEEAFAFEADIPVEIEAYKVPVFAIQTLIENAFKHNYFTEKRPLSIRISYADGELQVWNN